MPWSCTVCTVIVEIDSFLCCNVCGSPREKPATKKRPRDDEPEAVELPVKERKLAEAPDDAAPPPSAAAPTTSAAPPPQSHGAAGPRRSYVVLLMVEGANAEHLAYLERCEAACDDAIHGHCFQADGTRHFTIAKGSWTDAVAKTVRFASKPPLPANIPLTHQKSWASCLALGVDDATAATIGDVVARLALPAGARRTVDAAKLHLSLYRGRGRGPALKRQMPVLREAAGGGFGSVVAARVVVKVVGADYATSRNIT